jgi:hypothetical protein
VQRKARRKLRALTARVAGPGRSIYPIFRTPPLLPCFAVQRRVADDLPFHLNFPVIRIFFAYNRRVALAPVN